MKTRLSTYFSAFTFAVLLNGLQYISGIWKGAPFILLYPGIFLSIAIFGAGPAFLVLAADLLATFILYPIDKSSFWRTMIHTGLFAVTSFLTILLFLRNRRAHIRLQQREKEFKDELSRAQAMAHIGSWRFDLKQNKITWSDETYRIFKLPIGSPMSYPIFLSHMHADDLAYFEQEWGKALKGERYDIRHRILLDGEEKWVRERAEIEFDADGIPVGGIGTCQDVTDFVRTEEALKKAKLEAEHANIAKDHFLANISHELRTPLTTVQMWAEMMLAGKVPDKKIKFALKAIEQNAKSQAQIIEDLLDVSRIIAGKLKLELAPIQLNDVIREALDGIEASAHEKFIQIVTDLDPGDGTVLGDPHRLKQVLWNLLNNAVKFSNQGSVIEVRSKQRTGPCCEFQVVDHGKGIKPEILPKIFDRFVQADSTSTREQSGLGLGLSIVRDLVKLHNGTVTVESEGEGKGATFTVRVPVCDNLNQLAKKQNPDPGKGRPADLKGLHVLVVDDSIDTREVVAAALESMGAEVTTAESVRAALKSFETDCPDVLISDISMPVEDGYCLIREIRSVYKSSVPAIALTAYAGAVDARRALEAGFQMHLPKPINWIALGNAIAELADEDSRSVRDV